MTEEERRYAEISVQFVMIFPVQVSCVVFDCTELFLFRRSSSVMKNGSEEPFFMPPFPRGKVFSQAFRHTNNNLSVILLCPFHYMANLADIQLFSPDKKDLNFPSPSAIIRIHSQD